MTDAALGPIPARAAELAAAAERLGAVPACVRMAVRLRQALARLADAPAEPRPLVVALLGGTGVGKSHLFNSLIGKPDASPTSAAIRPKTARPVAAVARGDRPALQPLLDDLGAAVVDGDTVGVAFFDTPDVDSVEAGNRDLTRRVLDAADLLVYVTEPRKRANFAVHDEVRAWAERKRWVFVLNQADNEGENLPDVVADFDRRLRELRFDPSDAVRFAVSAKYPDRPRMAALREVLLAARPVRRRTLLPSDSFLGHLLYALDPADLDVLNRLADELAEREQEFAGRVRAAYRRGLAAPGVLNALAALVRDQTWRQLAERVWGPAALPIMARARLGVLGTSAQIGALLWRGPKLLSVVGVAAAVLADAVRGYLPLRRVVSALGDEFRREVAAVRDEARWVIEDRHITPPNGPLSAGSPALPIPAPPGPPLPIPVFGAVLEPVIARLTATPPPEDELLVHLRADVDRLARATVGAIAGKWTMVAANLLPLVVGVDVLYRIGRAWVRYEYPEGSFYAIAFLVSAASLLPAYVFLSARVRRRSEHPDPDGLIGQLDEPLATAQLRDASRSLKQLVTEASRLRRVADESRKVFAAEMGNRFGTQTRDTRT